MLFRLKLAVLFACCFFAFTVKGQLNDRPIIGILAQETKGGLAKYGPYYIAASYVKFVESAGARAVPVLANQTYDYYASLFKSINGVLFPGGGVSLINSSYARSASIFMKLALKANAMGDYFPIWGSCLGFEQLMILVAGEQVMTHCDAENLPLPLNFTKDADGSRIFQGVSDQLMKAMATEKVTSNFHHFCMERNAFYQNAKLSQFFRALSTNDDQNGLEFISTVEGVSFPVYGTQWHPEKNNFEFKVGLDIPHSFNAVQTSQTMANFFVNEARKSQHAFSSEQNALNTLIYNYDLVFTGRGKSGFDQCYFFY